MIIKKKITAFVVTNSQKGHFEAIESIRASPAIIVKIAIEKVQLSTLATTFSLFSPTDYLFLSLLAFKYYFSFFFYHTINQHLTKISKLTLYPSI